MGIIDWISKKMEEDKPRDFWAETLKEHDEWMKKVDQKLAERKKKADQKLAEWLEKGKQEAEEEHRQWEKQVAPRIKELKQAFEASGRKCNSAEPNEVEQLLTLTEKKIIQQCRRPKCHGCKLGWICPKFWSE